MGIQWHPNGMRLRGLVWCWPCFDLYAWRIYHRTAQRNSRSRGWNSASGVYRRRGGAGSPRSYGGSAAEGRQQGPWRAAGYPCAGLLRGASDVRVCHPNADSYKNLTPEQIYKLHENDKKRLYSSRVLEVERGTFTPLVFTTTGGMSNECQRYHSRLAELLAVKKQESSASTIAWIRTRVSFVLLRSALTCLRGSRFRRRTIPNIQETDLELEVSTACR